MRFCIIFGFLALLFRWLEAREIFARVRHVKAAINGTLQSAPEARPDTCPLQADIQDRFDWPLLIVFFLNMIFVTIDLLLALDGFVHAELFQHSSCDEQACSIGCCVILVACWNTIISKL